MKKINGIAAIIPGAAVAMGLMKVGGTVVRNWDTIIFSCAYVLSGGPVKSAIRKHNQNKKEEA